MSKLTTKQRKRVSIKEVSFQEDGGDVISPSRFTWRQSKRVDFDDQLRRKEHGKAHK